MKYFAIVFLALIFLSTTIIKIFKMSADTVTNLLSPLETNINIKLSQKELEKVENLLS